jgi:hypothetical protein
MSAVAACVHITYRFGTQSFPPVSSWLALIAASQRAITPPPPPPQDKKITEEEITLQNEHKDLAKHLALMLSDPARYQDAGSSTESVHVIRAANGQVKPRLLKPRAC